MVKAVKKYIAYCGWDCTKCLAYIATRENSDEKRRECCDNWNNAEWVKQYESKFKPEDINCDGCLAEICGHSDCSIRLCARKKGVINCACCGDYICGELDKYLKMVPGCKETLDNINKGIK